MNQMITAEEVSLSERQICEEAPLKVGDGFRWMKTLKQHHFTATGTQIGSGFVWICCSCEGLFTFLQTEEVWIQ